ncbi:MAG: MtrAB system histidine kinase MtrB [Actinomycetaceae bacterium]|nr:MtrAB system histidine kinase MtrB [Actinomycetaceae bacterium]
MTVRVVGVLVVAGIVVIGAVGAFVLSQVRTQLFDRAVSSAVDQFGSARQRAQNTIDAMTVPSSGQLQQLANELVMAQYDPVQSIMGGALLRSSKQSSAQSFEIAEPSTQSSAQIRTLITSDLRSAVSNSTAVHWQSVAVPDGNGKTEPGIVVGAQLRLQGAGVYEFYVAYSLDSELYTIQIMTRVLTIGATLLLLLIGVVTAVVVRIVLRPVREASKNARLLAEGGFDARMEVKGDDDLARLARSFNQMASSLSDQFTQLERMSNVQQAFVSAVSHELRSPVTTIRMAGQLIYDKRDELPSTLRRSAELQHDQLVNLDTMLSDLLEISRFDAGAMSLATESADLQEIAEQVISSQAPLAESNNVTVLLESRGDTTAVVEPRRIERIIRNLVVNALEHADAKPVRVLIVGGESAVAVEVSDRGIGLTEEEAAHVFDRFWRADTARVRKSGGTGLGLTIAREDAMLHGGKLQCAGMKGVGSTFLLTVPREAGETWSSPVQLRVAAAHEEWNVDSGAESQEGVALEAKALKEERQ